MKRTTVSSIGVACLAPMALMASAVSARTDAPAAGVGGLVLESTVARVANATDVALVRERFARSVLPTKPADIAHVEAVADGFARTIRPDGSWADIRYDATERTFWGAEAQLARALVMAKAARLRRDAGHRDAALDAKALAALKWWTDHDYQNSNWWWNQIGVPELVGETSVLLWPGLPPEELAKVSTIMKRSTWKTWTGANLTWGVINQIVRGCLEGDSATVGQAYDRLYGEIRTVSATQEGIQVDFSFHQHGVQLYNGGYGLSYVNDVGRFVCLAYGTPFQIPPDKMAVFSDYVLDGEQWMVRGDVFDYLAVGREITRRGKIAVPTDWSIGPISPAGPAYSMGNVVTELAAMPSPRRLELRAFAARLNGAPDAKPFVGNKQFWRSDYMTHRRATFFTSVKMLSNRIQNAELTNGEGPKSVHLSDGANLLYKTGDEYKDIFAVWDWTKVPGTTAIQGTLVTGEKNPIAVRGGSAFAGGVSDGTYGMCAMDLARGKLTAKKAWFFFDDAYVGLGAGITLADDTEHAVATDVNQTLLSGDVLTNRSSQAVAPGAYDSASGGDISYVYHDHAGYVFPSGSHVYLTLGPVNGRWSDIGAGPDTPVTRLVFNLWLDHGKACNNASYQYIVLPDTSPKATAHRASALGAELDVLANSVDLQAVYSRTLKQAQIAFRKPATLSTPLGAVTVDQACLLLIRETPTSEIVTAANPASLPLVVNVSVGGKHATITLPAGDAAGSSVSATLR